MEARLDEQQREIKDVVRRAKGNPDRTGILRRDTLRRLIDLTHSRYPALKILAAGDIRHFFKNFPDLEEAAVNAIYDLCEDQDPEVRMAGYSAVTQVSKDRPNWVKRNADVLVQLLQSDEPDEVVMVKKALIEHLDMDCCVTLGVLCDQIVPSEDPVDEEELWIRERLRSLVLSFITTEAKLGIIEQHANESDKDAEEILVNALWAVLPKLNNQDLKVIVQDLLAALPTFKDPHSVRGNDLLQLLLAKASASFRTDFRPGGHESFEAARFHLDLAIFIVLHEGISSPVKLLQFYCTSLIGKMTLAKLAPDDAVSVISDAAKILTACSDDNRKHPDAMLQPLQRQVVDACPILLERLLDSKTADMKSWKACGVLLRACLQRQRESSWTVPTPLSNILCKISVLPESQSEKAEFRDVQNHIRSLVGSNIKPGSQPPPAQATNISPDPLSNHAIIGDTKRSTNNYSRSSLPKQPSGTSPPPQGATLDTYRLTRDNMEVEPTDTIIGVQSRPTTPASIKRSMTTENASRPPKKVKQSDGSTAIGPSLLSRMGRVSTGPRIQTTSKPLHEQRVSQGTTPEDEESSAGGISILGAAKAQRHIRASPPPMSSLLDRMKELASEDNDRARRKKKKGRAHR